MKLNYLKSGFSAETNAISISFGFKSADKTVIKQEIANLKINTIH